MKSLIFAITDEPVLFAWSREWEGDIDAQKIAEYMKEAGQAEPITMYIIRGDEVKKTFINTRDFSFEAE